MIFFGKSAIHVSIGGRLPGLPRWLASQGFLARKAGLFQAQLALYLRKLAPGGRVLFHISSRTLNLAPVIGALANDAGVPARVLFDSPPVGTSLWRHSAATVVAVAGRAGDLSYLSTKDGWNELPPAKPQFLWTDQRADLLRVINFGF